MSRHAISPWSDSTFRMRRRLPGRRGVSSVLSMMFLVIFGSLAAAMAVVAQGNLRTADSSLKVSRAMSAAETGLTFAARRLSEDHKTLETFTFLLDELKRTDPLRRSEPVLAVGGGVLTDTAGFACACRLPRVCVVWSEGSV